MRRLLPAVLAWLLVGSGVALLVRPAPPLDAAEFEGPCTLAPVAWRGFVVCPDPAPGATLTVDPAQIEFGTTSLGVAVANMAGQGFNVDIDGTTTPFGRTSPQECPLLRVENEYYVDGWPVQYVDTGVPDADAGVPRGTSWEGRVVLPADLEPGDHRLRVVCSNFEFHYNSYTYLEAAFTVLAPRPGVIEVEVLPDTRGGDDARDPWPVMVTSPNCRIETPSTVLVPTTGGLARFEGLALLNDAGEVCHYEVVAPQQVGWTLDRIPPNPVPVGSAETVRVALAYVQRRFDLAVEKSVLSQEGIAVRYRVTVRNLGPDDTLDRTTLLEQPSPGLTVTAIDGDGWRCTPATLSCSHAPLEAGEAAEVTIEATLTASPGGTVTNTVTLADATLDPTREVSASNNIASAQVEVAIPTTTTTSTTTTQPTSTTQPTTSTSTKPTTTLPTTTLPPTTLPPTTQPTTSLPTTTLPTTSTTTQAITTTTAATSSTAAASSPSAPPTTTPSTAVTTTPVARVGGASGDATTAPIVRSATPASLPITGQPGDRSSVLGAALIAVGLALLVSRRNPVPRPRCGVEPKYATRR